MLNNKKKSTLDTTWLYEPGNVPENYGPELGWIRDKILTN